MDFLIILSQIALFFLLIIGSALFSGTETALFTLSRHRLHSYRKEHPRAVKILEDILSQPHEFISTILICNNFVNVAASALATQFCMAFWGESGVFIATFGVTVTILIGSEITPKTYAAAHPDHVGLKAALPLFLLIKLLKPANHLLSLAVNLLLKLLGLTGRARQPALSDAEIKSIILTGKQEGLLREHESSIITNVLDIDKIRAREVMKPRSQIVSLPLDSSLTKIRNIVKKHGFSRYPVYDQKRENIIGIIHIKDLFRATGSDDKPFSLRHHLGPVHFFPETATLDEIMENFRRQSVDLGIIVDEYGGIEGVLSRKDIIHEIIGHFENTPATAITALNNGNYLIPGTFPLRKIEQIIPELKFPRKIKYDNLASLILGRLGHIPQTGATIQVGALQLTVTSISRNRIVEVMITPPVGGVNNHN